MIKRRIAEHRYSSSPKGRLSRRLRQKKFRIRKNLEIAVTDHSNNTFDSLVKNQLNLIKKRTSKRRCCCRCQKKIKVIRQASDVNDTVNIYFSFTRYRKAYDYSKKTMESVS